VKITKIVEIDCHRITVLFWQHNMEFIKTEPDPGAELHPASCSGSQLLDVKEEVKPVTVRFPLIKTGRNANCFCVCFSVAAEMSQYRTCGRVSGTCF